MKLIDILIVFTLLRKHALINKWGSAYYLQCFIKAFILPYLKNDNKTFGVYRGFLFRQIDKTAHDGTTGQFARQSCRKRQLT